MRNKFLLDCTLRDGGYTNDWEFGNGNLTCIYNRLAAAGVDFIEIGFIDDRRSFDINRSIQPTTADFTKVFANIEKTESKTIAMIDYGTCSIDSIQKKEDSILDGIRLIFKKEKIDGAIEFAKQLKSKGYLVFLQMVSITAYSDLDLIKFIEKANAVHPYAVSIVDTYGLLHDKELMHIFGILDKNLLPDVAIGYHAHNNFQLGYSNCIKILENPIERDILVDGTLYGMGKSAGNAPLELLAMYLNDNCEKYYDLNSILEAIDNNVMNMYNKRPWGYTYVYYMSALNDCHPNYVTHLLNKNALSIQSINTILSQIPYENKLVFDQNLIDGIYQSYQNNVIDDNESICILTKELKNKIILLIGPGPSINTQSDVIENIINATKCVTISVNSLPNKYPLDYIFISNSKRYNLMYTQLKDLHDKIIATSNITPISHKFKFIINYEKYKSTKIEENSLVFAINLFTSLGISKILLAGFDGFSKKNSNYYDERLILHNNRNPNMFNKRISNYLKSINSKIDIKFITSTKYKLD